MGFYAAATITIPCPTQRLEGELRLDLIHRGIGARELLRQKDAVLTAAVAT